MGSVVPLALLRGLYSELVRGGEGARRFLSRPGRLTYLTVVLLRSREEQCQRVYEQRVYEPDTRGAREKDRQRPDTDRERALCVLCVVRALMYFDKLAAISFRRASVRYIRTMRANKQNCGAPGAISLVQRTTRERTYGGRISLPQSAMLNEPRRDEAPRVTEARGRVDRT